MRTWRQARRFVRCGGCGVALDPDAPVLVIQIGATRQAKYRCPACAAREYGETTPPDVGEDDIGDVRERPVVVQRPAPLRRADWKQIAAKGDD